MPLPPISGSGPASARMTERAADIAGSRLLGSGARQSRSASRWRASESTIAAWMSATVVGSPGAGRQMAGIAAASAPSASSTTGSVTGTHRATGMSRSVRMLGATSPAPTVDQARRATAASQAIESAVDAPTGIERSQRADQSAGTRTDAGRMPSPSGMATSSDERWPIRNGLAAEPQRGSPNARCSVFGRAV